MHIRFVIVRWLKPTAISVQLVARRLRSAFILPLALANGIVDGIRTVCCLKSFLKNRQVPEVNLRRTKIKARRVRSSYGVIERKDAGFRLKI